MVGATRWFISKPFDKRALINGLVSGVIASLGLWVVKTIAESWLPELKSYNEPWLLALLIIGLIVLGILISVISTHRSVIKYLKLRLDDLY